MSGLNLTVICGQVANDYEHWISLLTFATIKGKVLGFHRTPMILSSVQYHTWPAFTTQSESLIS